MTGPASQTPAPAPAPLVLLVDDDVLVLSLLQTTLEDGGFEVLEASTVAQALALLQRETDRIAALVTDVNLGREASGWEVGHRARELRPTLPVVYVSGDSGHEWASQGVPHSVMLEKPFAPAQLLTAVASLLNQAGGAQRP